MTNKPLLQEIEEALEIIQRFYDVQAIHQGVKETLIALREFKDSVDVEALDEAFEISREWTSDWKISNKAHKEKYGCGYDETIMKAATKLREIVGEK